jgi:hypothetical protein
VSIARAAKEQIARFLASKDRTINDPDDSDTLFELPIPLPLPLPETTMLRFCPPNWCGPSSVSGTTYIDSINGWSRRHSR